MNFVESFQTNRILKLLHSIVQLSLLFAVIAATNYIAMHKYSRIDVSHGHEYTLSGETIAYIRKLDTSVDIYVTLSADNYERNAQRAYRDIRALLREYEYTARNNRTARINVEFVNVYEERAKAQLLNLQRPNTVEFRVGERKRIIAANELYRYSKSEAQEFLGESIFTRSLLEITGETQPQILFTVGHGEMALDDISPLRGLSTLANELRNRNLNPQPIDLTQLESIPGNSVVVIAAPLRKFYSLEQQMLREYLRKENGRIVLLVAPNIDFGLDELLWDWGILAEDTLVVEGDSNSIIQGGDLMVRSFAPEHSITEMLFNQQTSIVTGWARSMREDPGRSIDDSLVVSEIMTSSPKSYSERSYRNKPWRYDEALDILGPISLAVTAERKVKANLGISVSGGRIACFGTTDFIANNRFVSAANFSLFLNTLNWATNRDTLSNIPSRPVKKIRLDLSQQQLLYSTYLIWLAPPILIGILGFLVYLTRRN